MKNILVLIVFMFGLSLCAQQVKDSIDSKYLEDQLYISLTYNLLTSKPKEISQNGFSGGFSIGFIKDLPLNTERDFGLGIGLGYAYNAYIQNLKISKESNTYNFNIAEDFNSNRIYTHAIELPLEFRFRNSTPTKYKFWRVYAGMKFSYLFAAKSIYKDDIEIITLSNNKAINEFQYGVILSAGYEVWNLYLYYGLKPLLKDAFLSEKKINTKDLHIGLKLYIM